MIKKILIKFGLYNTPYQKTKKEIKDYLKYNSLKNIDKWLKEKTLSKEFELLYAYRILFSILKNNNIEQSIKYGNKAQKIEFDEKIEQVLQNRKIFFEKSKYSIKKFKEFYEIHSLQEVEEWMQKAIKIKPELKLALYKAFFTLTKNKNAKKALEYGEKAIILGADEDFRKVVETREKWFKQKNIDISIDISDISIKEIKNIIENLSVDEAIQYINDLRKIDSNLEIVLKIFLIRKINKTEYEQTVEIALSIIEDLNDKSLLKIIAARAYAIKQYENALIFYKKYLALTKDISIVDRYINIILILEKSKILNLDDKSLDIYIKNIIEENFLLLKNKHKKYIKDLLYFEINFKLENYKEAIVYGQKIIKFNHKQYPIRLARAYFELGEVNNAITNSSLDNTIEKHKNLIEVYQSYLNLLENGFKYSLEKEKLEISSNKILYVLNNSLPYHSNGYATRAHGLLEGIKHLKNIEAITRLGYPHDLAKFRNKEYIAFHQVDSIKYNHLNSENLWLNYIPLDEYLIAYGEKLSEFVKANNFQYIHSASNFVNGLAANYAAKKLGLKSIYEVRGLWEITRISRQPEWKNSEYYNMIKKLETQAASEADIVITITYALKKELVKRGVLAEKIFVLPNGVDSSSFVPIQKDISLMESLGIKENEVVIGYIGSIVEYEGIDLLIESLALLKEKNLDFKFLLVGDGRYFDVIKNKIQEFHLEDNIIVTGRVPHDEVEKYYSLIEIAPLPRKAVPVSEIVSPLKPFEAMATGKIVLGSSVEAIAEIIQDGYNGMLFEKDNVNDLADKLELLIQNENLRKEISKNAREWAVAERDWRVLAKELNEIYEKLH